MTDTTRIAVIGAAGMGRKTSPHGRLQPADSRRFLRRARGLPQRELG
jgi:hypothetical protein